MPKKQLRNGVGKLLSDLRSIETASEASSTICYQVVAQPSIKVVFTMEDHFRNVVECAPLLYLAVSELLKSSRSIQATMTITA